MTTLITRPKALDLLREAVKVKGADHKQFVCSYVEGVKGEPMPGCIVGQALTVKVGFDKMLDVFAVDPDEEDHIAVQRNNAAIVDTFSGEPDSKFAEALDALGLRLSAPARKVWDLAQKAQDGRLPVNADGSYRPKMTWGEALAFAEATA